jgi:Domain of unknown function (DUF4328)
MRSATALRGILATYLTVKCAFIVSCVMQIQLIARAPVSMAAAQANDRRQQLLAYSNLVLLVATLVAYFVWIYHAKKRAEELGGSGFEYSPGLSVGCHFVPLGNLYMPFKAMSELWRAGINPADWEVQPLSPAVGWWWALWLMNGFFGYAVYFTAKGGSGLDHLRLVTKMFIVSGVFSIAANGLLLFLAARISENLEMPPMIDPSKMMQNPSMDTA